MTCEVSCDIKEVEEFIRYEGQDLVCVRQEEGPSGK